MEKLNSLSIMEKEQLIYYLGQIYRNGTLQERAMSMAARETEKELIELLQTLLKGMNRKYALIILNDFFEIKEKGWWHSMYSRSTYYRYKRTAVALLLEQLYYAQ